MQEKVLRKLKTLIWVAIILFCSGCYYPGINGKVVDTATGQPLEGAVVVAQWRKTRGIPGLQYSDLHKSVETLTDKKGAFSLEGAFGLLLEPPRMAIYKAGYIPWRNDMVFPGGHITKNHEWNNNMTYKLDVFTNKFTYRQLYSFLSYGIKVSGDRATPIYDDLMHQISVLEQTEIEKQVEKDNKK
jgi:hypothetical protein